MPLFASNPFSISCPPENDAPRLLFWYTQPNPVWKWQGSAGLPVHNRQELCQLLLTNPFDISSSRTFVQLTPSGKMLPGSAPLLGPAGTIWTDKSALGSAP